MPQNYERMTEAQFEDLMERVNNGAMEPEEVFVCNASPNDHMHFRLLGDAGDVTSRLGIFVHSATGMSTMFFSARDARALAEHFHAIAERIDGQAVSYEVPDTITSLLPPEEPTD